MGSLDGKVALVTGGSRGIGAAIAKRLAEDGADVAITYQQSADKAAKVVATVEEQGRRGLALQADAADADAVTAAVDRTATELGRLDILVNNAGVMTGTPFESLSVTEVDHMLAVNVRAVVVATQAALRHLPRGGRVISIGSDLAERVPFPGVSLYSATKAALVGLTRGLARDLGPRGVTATVVHPGSTDTDMNPADGPGAAGQLAHIALGHYAEAADVAATVSHVAGPDGRYLTGGSITVDGGFTA
ncbi:SDR family NAD(P)-dependent oxidoreductase [Amycolatopsis rhabdoformis]|uniref:SDR family NAD(P)-dependent oxidoreductase n=1 Tax=Amycolatopsis rhabdoformis TaxID=1448059 RepID=A0ABZ1I4I6_9PSEU|nr:SDR family NAD(P)-dependent oxidoreductase [Amycolatopsis rhabdoformis]WSE29195.1 SDR family NAD(P)-dependent oxidoreductase [Amycolatopsis rhabdoformis]